MPSARPEIRIGISGWTYAPWRGVFYPRGLPRRQELAFAASQFRAIEINGTFYRMQRPESFADWACCTPDDFVFAVKGPRFITHMLKLRGAETALANFFASGLLRLGPKLGPILWQFPARFAFDAARLDAFLAMLPQDGASAAALAERHDARLAGRAWTRAAGLGRIRHAVEIRHDSFRDPHFLALLRAHRAALVVADAVQWPLLGNVTSDFVYCRLHGSAELYASGYDEAALDAWARRVRIWAAGGEPDDIPRIDAPAPPRTKRDVFVFFDNDAKVRAPFDARGLAARLSGAINRSSRARRRPGARPPLA